MMLQAGHPASSRCELTCENRPTGAPAPDSSVSRQIAEQATFALLAELAAWPKPGLVSPVDSGSHSDMDAPLLEASARTLQPFFAELADAGQKLAPMDVLREIGLRAEKQMLFVTQGVNTHRGAIFGLGLLCAAAGVRQTTEVHEARLGAIVAQWWGNDIERGPIPLYSHGTTALRRHGAGGARAEAAAGFPSVYDIALPALREGLRVGSPAIHAGPVQACFALIASVEDTNLLHRGGKAGADFAAACARDFLSKGGVNSPGWQDRAAGIHAQFIAHRLSPGGCADLLAMALFVEAMERP